METFTSAESSRSVVDTSVTLTLSVDGFSNLSHPSCASAVTYWRAAASSPAITAAEYRCTTPAGVDASRSLGAPREKTTERETIISTPMTDRMIRRVRSGRADAFILHIMADAATRSYDSVERVVDEPPVGRRLLTVSTLSDLVLAQGRS